MIYGAPCNKHPELNGKRYNSGHCVACKKASNRNWEQRNADAVRENGRTRMERWRDADTSRKVLGAEKALDYYYRDLETNREKARLRRLEWYVKNPDRAIFAARVRRDRIAQQMPSWADRKAINEIYRKAKELNLTVDHVVPLRGKLVSGLHVESNLNLVSRSENSSKSNSFSIQ